jgi:hypothetical protein
VKKKIIGVLLAVVVVGACLLQVVPALADTPQPLDRVVISPATVSLPVAGSQHFNAQAYDASNQPINNVTFFWMVVSGGGTINASGDFIATTPGTFYDAVEVVAVQNKITRVATANVTVTASVGPLSKVNVMPGTVTLKPGATKQFSAQAVDANGVALAGYTYSWTVAAGGGTIDPTSGLFTAGTAVATFTNTVQVLAVNGTSAAMGQATVVVTNDASPARPPQPYLSRLDRLFNSYLGGRGFESFLGGQWQVKNGTGVDTIKVIPGIVQAATAGASLTVLPNGQTAPLTFSLTDGTKIQPKGVVAAVNDKVLVVTVNDKVERVVVLKAPAPAQTPPGINKKGDDKREGKKIPFGWFRGNKVGWSQDKGDHHSDKGDD